MSSALDLTLIRSLTAQELAALLVVLPGLADSGPNPTDAHLVADLVDLLRCEARAREGGPSIGESTIPLEHLPDVHRRLVPLLAVAFEAMAQMFRRLLGAHAFATAVAELLRAEERRRAAVLCSLGRQMEGQRQ